MILTQASCDLWALKVTLRAKMAIQHISVTVLWQHGLSFIFNHPKNVMKIISQKNRGEGQVQYGSVTLV